MLRKPTFVGVGVMKSATTWISECLRSHPEIYVSNQKELHFFSHNWDSGVDKYLKNFKDAKDVKEIGEYSVSYMDDPVYCDRIYEVLGNTAKIIICLRNPTERFISHYKHNLRVFADTNVYKKDKLDYEIFQKAINHDSSLLKKGEYYNSVKYFMDVFGPDQVLILFKEEIDNHPESVVLKLYDFLNVDAEFRPNIIDKMVSPGIIPKYKFLEEIRVRIFKLAKTFLPKAIVITRRLRLAEFYRKLNKSKEDLIIGKKVTNYLKEFYKEDINNLENLLKLDLKNWK